MNMWSPRAATDAATDLVRKFVVTATFLATALSPCTLLAQIEFKCPPIHNQDVNSHSSLYDGSYALLVGVSRYEYWGQLPNVPKQINQLADILCKKRFQRYCRNGSRLPETPTNIWKLHQDTWRIQFCKKQSIACIFLRSRLHRFGQRYQNTSRVPCAAGR